MSTGNLTPSGGGSPMECQSDESTSPMSTSDRTPPGGVSRMECQSDESTSPMSIGDWTPPGGVNPAECQDQQEHLEPAPREGEDSPTSGPPDRNISATETSTTTSTIPDQIANNDNPIVYLSASQDQECSETVPKTTNGTPTDLLQRLFPWAPENAFRKALVNENQRLRQANAELKKRTLKYEKLLKCLLKDKKSQEHNLKVGKLKELIPETDQMVTLQSQQKKRRKRN
ncbi:uncharacterized protein [Macrobrachium rosenbergii]